MLPLVRPRNAGAEKGFTLFEVMVAIVVLTIGLMSAAALMANIYKLSVRSRYMAMATQLASEELEDLNRWPATTTFVDPHITVPAGSNTCGIAGETCIGSLTPYPSGCTDGPCGYGPINITVSGNTSPVSYFDSVCLTAQNGQMTETYQNPNSSSASYSTLTFFPSGIVPTVQTSSTQPLVGMTFTRRWVIEQDKPVVGVRRITVLVTLDDRSVGLYSTLPSNELPPPSVTFQMSMVRP